MRDMSTLTLQNPVHCREGDWWYRGVNIARIHACKRTTVQIERPTRAFPSAQMYAYSYCAQEAH